MSKQLTTHWNDRLNARHSWFNQPIKFLFFFFTKERKIDKQRERERETEKKKHSNVWLYQLLCVETSSQSFPLSGGVLSAMDVNSGVFQQPLEISTNLGNYGRVRPNGWGQTSKKNAKQLNILSAARLKLKINLSLTLSGTSASTRMCGVVRVCDKHKSILAHHLLTAATSVNYLRIKHHPYFWTPEQTLDFLLAAAIQVDRSIGSDDPADQYFLHRLECEEASRVTGGDWIARIHPTIKKEISLPNDNNIYSHVSASIGHLLLILRSLTLRRQRSAPQVPGPIDTAFCYHWIHRFPRLVIHVYRACYHLRTAPQFQQFYTFFDG